MGERKTEVFIFKRIEIVWLSAIFTSLAAFFFTIGIHYGKEKKEEVEIKEMGIGKIDGEEDKLPSQYEISEQMRAIETAMDESLKQTLHEEVTRTGLKLEQKLAIDLPKDAKTLNQGATTVSLREQSIPAFRRATPLGSLTLQVGKFSSLEEARNQVDSLEALNLMPFLRSEEDSAKGKWYAVFLDGYESKSEAEEAGNRYSRRHMIERFEIVSMPGRAPSSEVKNEEDSAIIGE